VYGLEILIVTAIVAFTALLVLAVALSWIEISKRGKCDTATEGVFEEVSEEAGELLTSSPMLPDELDYFVGDKDEEDSWEKDREST